MGRNTWEKYKYQLLFTVSGCLSDAALNCCRNRARWLHFCFRSNGKLHIRSCCCLTIVLLQYGFLQYKGYCQQQLPYYCAHKCIYKKLQLRISLVHALKWRKSHYREKCIKMVKLTNCQPEASDWTFMCMNLNERAREYSK